MNLSGTWDIWLTEGCRRAGDIVLKACVSVPRYCFHARSFLSFLRVLGSLALYCFMVTLGYLSGPREDRGLARAPRRDLFNDSDSPVHRVRAPL